MTEEIAEFLGRTERLCRVLANSINTNAEHDTEKEKLLKMADEAADLACGLGFDTNRMRRGTATKALVNLDDLREALA
jgi:hypothetical protein